MTLKIYRRKNDICKCDILQLIQNFVTFANPNILQREK